MFRNRMDHVVRVWRRSFSSCTPIQRLYLTSTDYVPHTAPLLLGLASVLEQKYGRIGYFRPILPTRKSAPIDHHVPLMQKLLGLEPHEKKPLYAVTSEEAVDYCLRNQQDQLIDRVLFTLEKAQEEHDFMIIEGSAFPSHETNSVSWQLHKQIANALGARVVLCMDAGTPDFPSSDSELIDAIVIRALLGREQAEADRVGYFGTLINRVGTSDPSAFALRLEKAFEKHKLPYLGFLPYDRILASRRLNEVADRLGAKAIVDANESAKTVSISEIVVASSQLKEFLHHVKDRKDGLLVLTSADRSDMLLGLLASRLPGILPRIAGILLTNGEYPDSQTQAILQGVAESRKAGLSIPIYLVGMDTYTASAKLSRIRTGILPTSVQKITASQALMERFMNKKLLVGELAHGFISHCSPKQFEHILYIKARQSHRHIVLPEGNDDRILRAADEILRSNLAKLTILGDVHEIQLQAKTLGLDLSSATLINPVDSEHLERYIDRYLFLRRHKGVVKDMARDVVIDATYFGTMMVEMGDADGMVSGAYHTTADTIRPALQLIKTFPDRPLVSSIFFMGLEDGVRIFGDCAVNANPSAEQLAQIAVTSAESAQAFGMHPRVAMLSYATGESNSGPNVDKVREATRIAQTLRPDLDIFGPIQYDAAVDQAVAKQKIKTLTAQSERVGGHANVLIFPDLNAGNNTYKAVQQATRCIAIGPMLQGLRKPVNDLSRGASVKDIVTTVAITAIQAHQMQSVSVSSDSSLVPGKAKAGSSSSKKSNQYDVIAISLLVFRLVEFAYLSFSIPLRVGFYFDPFQTHASGSWSTSLTVFTLLDVVAEAIAIGHVAGLGKRQRRAIASLADAAASHNVHGRRARATPMRSPSFRDETSDSVRSSDTRVVEGLSVIHLVSMVPLECIAGLTGANTLHVLRLHRLLRLEGFSSWWTSVNETFASVGFLKRMHSGEKLLYQTILVGGLVCHIAACGYMLIAHVECGLEMELCELVIASSAHRRLDTMASRTCWAVEDRLLHASTFRKYSRSLYWASRTLITLGYYDVAPRTDLETIFSIGIQLLGAVFSTSIIATLLFIFRYRNLRRAKFNAHVDNAKHLMKLYKLPKKMQKRVFQYYDHVWSVYSGLPEEHHVLEKLPEHLQTQIRYQVRIKPLYSVSFLGKEQLEFVNMLAVELLHRIYAPKDWIVRRVPTSLYFVSIGEVVLLHKTAREGRTKLIGVGTHFGSNALLYADWNVDIVARAHTFCELHHLPHHAFQDTLHAFFGDQAGVQLERMRVKLSRQDQQQQKTEKMLGKMITQRPTVFSIGDVQEDKLQAPVGVYRTIHWARNIRPRNWFRDWTLPESSFRYCWEHLRFACLTFIAFEVPFYLAFDGGWPFFMDDRYAKEWIWSIVVELFFGLDFIFQCRYFTVQDPVLQTLVHDPNYLVEHYKRNGMRMDAVALIPLPLILEILSFGPIHSRWMYLFRLFRLCRLSKFHFYLSEIVRLRNLSSRVEHALGLILYVTWTMHVTGCLWFEMARLSVPPVFPIEHKA
uniref:Phosphate acetyltransferase n=1 Tax=Albugo laibachii Nc14 TaxID=890382 RepID=F0WN86_9STRA|nr:phosphate acetyltransferase putative [Albugo laibachii Nc14]|eukprot:CCA22775.1 phosphate acetyltransferase putative [Albugo laibachii Nc14]